MKCKDLVIIIAALFMACTNDGATLSTTSFRNGSTVPASPIGDVAAAVQDSKVPDVVGLAETTSGGDVPITSDIVETGDVAEPPAPDTDAPADGAADAVDIHDATVSVDTELSVTPPITVAVVSDLNGSYGSTSYRSGVHAAMARIVSLGPDLVLSTGDMVAGQQAGLDYLAMWDAFHDAVSDPLVDAGIPFAVSPGNHDASGYASYTGERAIYVDEWDARIPAVDFVDATNYPLRYSFSVGPAFFISLDDTTVGPLDSDQVDWVEAQLAANADAPVKVVFGHLPLYPFAEGSVSNEFIGDASFEALLKTHGVDLFLSGHHHAYYPGRRGALRLVSLACLGSGQRQLLGESTVSPRSFVLLEISDTGITLLDAYGGSDFDEPIQRTTLPSSIGEGTMVITRDDL